MKKPKCKILVKSFLTPKKRRKHLAHPNTQIVLVVKTFSTCSHEKETFFKTEGKMTSKLLTMNFQFKSLRKLFYDERDETYLNPNGCHGCTK